MRSVHHRGNVWIAGLLPRTAGQGGGAAFGFARRQYGPGASSRRLRLGKCQRMIVMLRKAGYDAPIFLHGALVGLCSLYERLGINLGALRPVREQESMH